MPMSQPAQGAATQTCYIDDEPLAAEDIVGYAVLNGSPDIMVFCIKHGAAFSAALRRIARDTNVLQM